MEAGRLKSVAILILALVNLAFGVILLGERLDSADLQAQTRSELVSVLRKRGVELAETQLPTDGPERRFELSRDIPAEAALAEAVLGNASGRDQGGSIYYYENENGWARFRGSGSFEIAVLSPGGSIEERLKDGGMSLYREGEAYVCTWAESPVFNCRFSLSAFSGGGLLVSGRRLPGSPGEGREAERLDAATLLLRFLDQTNALGVVFTRIERIQPGYALQVTASSAELLPVWQLETNGGVWYLDTESGELLTGLS